MGFDLYTEVYKKNSDGKYEKLALYDKDGKEVYFPFASRNHCFNQLMSGYSRSGDYDFESPFDGRGIPEWYVEASGKEYKVEGNHVDALELYAAQGNPRFEYPDYNMWDEMDVPEDKLPRIRPLDDFVSVLDIWLNMTGVYRWTLKPGDVIVVFVMSY